MLGERSGEALARAHTLEMENREKMRLTGVSDVSGFDENVVVLMTDMGELSIRGEALHIARIDLEAGILELRGRVNGLSYEERTVGGSAHRRYPLPPPRWAASQPGFSMTCCGRSAPSEGGRQDFSATSFSASSVRRSSFSSVCCSVREDSAYGSLLAF